MKLYYVVFEGYGSDNGDYVAAESVELAITIYELYAEGRMKDDPRRARPVCSVRLVASKLIQAIVPPRPDIKPAGPYR